MKKVTAILCSAAAVLVLSSAAFAQGQGRGRGFGFGGGLNMLRIEKVQQELKMTQPQIDKIAAKQQELQAANQGVDFQNMSQEERQAFFQKSQAAQAKAVADILDSTQLKRYHQLELQQQGAGAFNRKEVADQLKLTEEQKKKIQAIQQGLQEERRGMMQGVDFQNMTPEDRQKLFAKFQDLQKSSNEKTEAVLTDDQKKTWKEMLGAKFDFPPPGPPRRQ